MIFLKQMRKQVSILVLVDFALKLGGLNNPFPVKAEVSILVLVDFALKHHCEIITKKKTISFNPCFGGFCS